MSEFVDYLKDILRNSGAIRSRKMFGGHGIYCNDIMIGLVADEVLYLKTDSESVKLFEEKGLEPFEFVKNGQPMKMSYFMAPEEIYDDPDEADRWASIAYDAALRSKKPARKKRSKR